MKHEIKSVERTSVRLEGTVIELTLEDAKAIREALADYLRRSTHKDRDELLKWIGPAFIDGKGTLRVGPWVLGSDRTGLFLRLRDGSGRLPAKAHRAHLERTDEVWRITNLVTERIHASRSDAARV